MDYKRPEDIDINFLNLKWSDEKGLMPLVSEEEKKVVLDNFRLVAFYIFTVLENGYHKIEDYEIKGEYQKTNGNENILLYFNGKLIFKLIGCNSGAWIVAGCCSPETIERFLDLVDRKFNVADYINKTTNLHTEYNESFTDDDKDIVHKKQSGNSHRSSDFDKTKDAFGRPLKKAYPGLFWPGMTPEEEEKACDDYWAMVRHIDKDIFHKE